MKSRNCDAFTGLEAAIVLIAFVIVAAVFSYVYLGAGFYTTQKSQETVYKAVDQTTSNIQLVGSIYGNGTSVGTGAITRFNFTVTLAPGANPVDLSKMTILVSNESFDPVTYYHTDSIYGPKFSANIHSTSTRLMKEQEQVQIGLVAPQPLPSNTKVVIEIRPAIGAALLLEKRIPVDVSGSQALH